MLHPGQGRLRHHDLEGNNSNSPTVPLNMMTNLDDNNPAENSFDDNVDTIQSSPIVVHDHNDRRPRRNTGSWKDGPARLREVTTLWTKKRTMYC